jgi:hypothetical protein
VGELFYARFCRNICLIKNKSQLAIFNLANKCSVGYVRAMDLVICAFISGAPEVDGGLGVEGSDWR